MYLCLLCPHFSLILVSLSAGEHNNFSYGCQGDFQGTNEWSLSFDKV